MNKKFRKRLRRSFKLHSHVEEKGSAEEMAARLAPLEEQTDERKAQAGANNNGGAIVVDTGKLKLPEAVAAEQEKRRQLLGLEPVVLVIIIIALAFIAFVAWQITKMEMPTDDPPPASAERGG